MLIQLFSEHLKLENLKEGSLTFLGEYLLLSFTRWLWNFSSKVVTVAAILMQFLRYDRDFL